MFVMDILGATEIAGSTDTTNIVLLALLILGVTFILAGCSLALWTVRYQRKGRVMQYSSEQRFPVEHE